VEVFNRHAWNVTPAEAVQLQHKFKSRIILTGEIPQPLHLIAGADVSVSMKTGKLYAGIVILEYPSFTLRETAISSGDASFPYVPGLLSFREGQHLLECFRKIQNIPDAVIFDGQGYAHPRRFGIASHLGYLINLPSVGSAKKLLVGTHAPVGECKNDYRILLHKNEEIGSVLRTRDRVKPVYVSPGHLIGFNAARDLVLQTCTRYRLPEPIREAHNLVNRVREESES
jgi:deoxyribonuclease V